MKIYPALLTYKSPCGLNKNKKKRNKHVENEYFVHVVLLAKRFL